MPNRNVTIQLVRQTGVKCRIPFKPRVTSIDGGVLLRKVYYIDVAANGTGSGPLPCKSSGSIAWDVDLPSDDGRPTTKYFVLPYGDGSDVALGTLIAAGGVASDSVIEYVDSAIAGIIFAMGGTVSGGTAGNIPWLGAGSVLSEDDRFQWDYANRRLQLGDKDYNGGAVAGWSDATVLCQAVIGDSAARLENTKHVYGLLIDVNRTQSAAGLKQTSAIRARVNVAKTAGTGTTTAIESFVTNIGDTTGAGACRLQAVEGIAFAANAAFDLYGGYFTAGTQSGGTPGLVSKLAGVFAQVSTYSGWTVTDAIAVDANVYCSNGATVNAFGLRMVGWTGSAVDNSYGIYADTSIDRGTVSKHFIYSLALSPSLITGPMEFGSQVTMNEQAAPSAPSANKAIVFFQDNGAGKTQMMVQFASGAAQQIAIQP